MCGFMLVFSFSHGLGDFVMRERFFLLGAPKCGTTALSEYLRSHPKIFFSVPKEPNFYARDIVTRYETKDRIAYDKCFDGVGVDHVWLGEGTVHYMQSRVAVRGILEDYPNARFVIILRNPIDLAYSWHSECRYNFGETEAVFEKAWGLQAQRRVGHNVPSGCPDPKLLDYFDVASIGSQLERVFACVNRSNVLVLFNDDMRTNAKSVYESVLKFLSLESDGRDHFPSVNDAKEVRSSLMMEVSHFVASAKKALGIQGGFGLIEKINVVRKPRTPLSDAFRGELVAAFQEEISKLERLTGRDLTAWRN